MEELAVNPACNGDAAGLSQLFVQLTNELIRMHTLFTLEDRYGLEVCECEDEVHLRVHIHKGRDAAELHRMLSAWGAIAAKLKAGEITKEEYDRWRYRYPELDTSGRWHKITPSQGLSDLLLADLKEHSEE